MTAKEKHRTRQHKINHQPLRAGKQYPPVGGYCFPKYSCKRLDNAFFILYLYNILKHYINMKKLPSEEEEIPFRIKTYKKKELACMYNPNITPRCAIRIFTKWIKINKELLRLLTATGLSSAYTNFYSPTGTNHNQYSGHSIRMSRILVLSLQLSRRFQISQIIHSMSVHLPKNIRTRR